MSYIEKIKYILRPYFVPHRKLIIFNYHQVSQTFNHKKHITGIWTHTELFFDQINYLLKNYDIVNLDDGLSELQSKKLDRTKIVITFDDGDRSVEEFVLPFLEFEGVPATFFINSAYLEGEDICWTDAPLYYPKNCNVLNREMKHTMCTLRNTLDTSEYSKTEKIFVEMLKNEDLNYKRYVGKQFLQNLNPGLFRIGLHGHNHHRFSMMSKAWQIMDLKKNIEILSQYENYIPVFAIPFGKNIDWNKTTLEVCHDLGVTPLFANGGYNTIRAPFGFRIPSDSRSVSELINNLSPFVTKYK